jgi:3-oxoacyl-(acyl-carrier-protein) synthase
VLGEAVHADVSAAMVNAFAFGGANVSLVVRRAS